jgi:DNA polymerase-3 subunit delta
MKPRKVEAPKITKFGERRDFVRRELRSDGGPSRRRPVAALLEAVGNDLRELSSPAAQLLADTSRPDHGGGRRPLPPRRAESSGFTVGRPRRGRGPRGALELARWGQSAGLAPVPRHQRAGQHAALMALVASAGRAPAHQLAGQLGMPPWKVEKTQRQARGWRPEGPVRRADRGGAADADVKGAAADQDYAVERLLLSVEQARGTGRDHLPPAAPTWATTPRVRA